MTSPRIRSGHIVKRGARGPAVVWIQDELRKRGYEPGPSDGEFGFLTEDAVRQLQQDYALRPDGRAGPEVYGVLASPRPLTIGRGRDLRIRGSEDRGAVGSHPSQMARWLLLGTDESSGGAAGQRTVARHGHHVTGIVDRRPWAEWPATLPWPEGTPGWVDLPLGADIMALGRRPVLGWKRRWEAVRAKVTEAAEWAVEHGGGRVRGFHVARGPVPWGQGALWARGLAALSHILWRYRLTVVVSLSSGHVHRVPRRLTGDLHLERWVSLTEAVIVPAPALGSSDTFFSWYGRLASARTALPLWKCVAGLDLRAVERTAKGKMVGCLPHQKALALCFRHRVRPVWDEAGGCYRAVYEDDGNVRHLYLWADKTVLRRLEQVRVWGLAGALLGPAGSEDQRIWDVVRRLFPVARHDGPVPGIRFHEREGGSDG